MSKKKIMFVFGTRPEAIKMAPVITELAKHAGELEPRIVVTGQHRQMLDQVLQLFQIKPDHDLKIMTEGQTLTEIVTRTLSGLAGLLEKERPDLLLVQGDTSSAFAAGLAAFYHKIPVGHVEAGLRTFDKWRPYPEEINRKLLTSLADLHFAPTAAARDNLLAEKVPPEAIYLTGNTVIDALMSTAEKALPTGVKLSAGKKLLLVTAHRRENFGEPLRQICRAVLRLVSEAKGALEVVVPVHKNPEARETVRELLGKEPGIQLTEPLDYGPFVQLMKASYLILSDSGGVQEEAPSLGKPVLVLRETTERPEAVSAGAVKLVGSDEERIFQEADRLLNDSRAYEKMSRAVNPYGDGKAAERTVQAIRHYFRMERRRPAEFRPREKVPA